MGTDPNIQTMSYTLSGMTGEAALITDERALTLTDRINGIAYYKENKTLGNL